MPERIKTPNWTANLISTVWLQEALKKGDTGEILGAQTPAAPVANILKKEWGELLGEHMPRIRKVQGIIQETKDRFGVIFPRKIVEPLGEGWPKDPADVAYLVSLDRLSKKAGTPSAGMEWELEEVKVALELKNILEPHLAAEDENLFNELLQHPYLNVKVPGALAIIKELAIRRKLEQGNHLVKGHQVNYGDIYSLLIGWRSLEEASVETSETSQFRFSQVLWSPILLQPTNHNVATEVCNDLGELLTAAENYSPPLDYQEFADLYTPDEIDEMNDIELGNARIQLQKLFLSYRKVLMTCEENAPVYRLNGDEDTKESTGPLNWFNARQQWVEKSSLGPTWEFCVDAMMLAKWIVAHYVVSKSLLEGGGTLQQLFDNDDIQASQSSIDNLVRLDLNRLGHFSRSDLNRPPPLKGRLQFWCRQCKQLFGEPLEDGAEN